MSRFALDTSASVPFLVRSHAAHTAVSHQLEGVETVLTAHSLAETYSVLTRLPGDARLAPPDAVRLIDANMGPTIPLTDDVARDLHHRLARLGIAGGAVYDALVGLAAKQASAVLATRDLRAAATYTALEVDYHLLGRTSGASNG